jgi:heme exporter protein B
MLLSRLLQQECILSFRKLSAVLNPLVFFVIVVSLFPLVLGSKPTLLINIAPGVIWVAALLANLLSLNRLFQDDFQDGSIMHMFVSEQSLTLILYIKMLVYWLTSSVPLMVITPLLALMYGLHFNTTLWLLLTLLLGTPILAGLGAVISALTVGLANSGVLLALLILPLMVPVLIFAANSVQLVSVGIAINGQLAILAALSCAVIAICPWLAGIALRIGIE